MQSITTKPVTLTALVVAVSLLSACSTTMSTKSDTGFLTSYEGLTTTEGNSEARVQTRVAIDPSRIAVAEVVWRVPAGGSLNDVEQTKLLAQFRHELIQQTRNLPASVAGRPVRLRAAITRVETVSPVLNTVGMLLLIGPLDRGGMAVEIEAIDAETGSQLAGLRLGYYAPLSEFSARFGKLAPAEVALQRAAKEFVSLLQPGAAPATVASWR